MPISEVRNDGRKLFRVPRIQNDLQLSPDLHTKFASKLLGTGSHESRLNLRHYVGDLPGSDCFAHKRAQPPLVGCPHIKGEGCLYRIDFFAIDLIYPVANSFPEFHGAIGDRVGP